MRPSIVRNSKDGALLTVHVQPKSSRTACMGPYGDALKIRIAAPPVDGAANQELIEFLAAELSVPPASFRIESGAGGRRKLVLVKGVRAEQIEDYLARNGW